MADYTELTPEDLHAATSKDVEATAATEDRIPSGKYFAKTVSVIRKRTNDDAPFNAGRCLATLTTTLSTLEAPAEAIGRMFIDVSWEPRYRTDGKLDNMARRYVELVRALGVRGGSPETVLIAAQQQLFAVKVRETFRVDAADLLAMHEKAKVGADGTAWVNIGEGETDQEAYDHYYDCGYESKVMIDRIYKAK